MWYKVDWDRLVLLLLPTFLRKPVLFGYLKALISPIGVSPDSVHYRWLQMRESNLKKLSYNGQRCYLRGALNDVADKNLRRIYIDETQNNEPDYIYTPDENLDVYLGIMYIESDFNYSNTTVDFLVYVPESVWQAKENEINAVLEFYTLAGKSYKIITI